MKDLKVAALSLLMLCAICYLVCLLVPSPEQETIDTLVEDARTIPVEYDIVTNIASDGGEMAEYVGMKRLRITAKMQIGENGLPANMGKSTCAFEFKLDKYDASLSVSCRSGSPLVATLVIPSVRKFEILIVEVLRYKDGSVKIFGRQMADES